MTNYAEVVKVVFDRSKTDYETVAKTFFNIHDPTQVNRQGPDIGEQYRSEIFYANMKQKKTSEKLIGLLEKKGFDVATKLSPAETFWDAEDYHQDYYAHKGGEPYCHAYTERF
jgi:peptide methionine sulfoxide reductase msrA/msrB